MARRVVITGFGAVSALGIGTQPLWDGLCSGASGLKRIARFDPSGFLCRLGGEVDNYSVRDLVPKHYRKATKVMARDIELAIGAAMHAVADAGLVTRSTLDVDADPAAISQMTYPGPRMGCQIGAGLISADADELAAAMVTSTDATGKFDIAKWGSSGMENLTPLWMLKYLPNMVSCHVTIIHGAMGPSNTITCAEASGLLSIGESMRIIERNGADLCFSGGAESRVNLMGVLRLELAGRLASTGDETDGARVVRPFDADAPGGILGEGAGLLLLEALDTAKARNARIHAELIGYGGGHSGLRPTYRGQSGIPTNFDINASDEGFQFAIQNALDDAGITPDQVDAVVTLGSGVPVMDMGEAGALRAIFGSRLPQVPIVTIGPSLGNCMAGSAGLIAVVAAMCVSHQRLPARINHGRCIKDIQAGAMDSRPAKLRYVVAASSSMGGQNAAIVLAPAPQ